MNDVPRVSVIVPAYNYGHYLAEAIDSVLGQSFRSLELVVVDDGSTDNTRDVVCGFTDPRARYVYQENRGPSSARNRGFEMSHGEYVVFLDGDDVLLEDAVRTSVNVLDRHPEAGFSYGQAYMMDAGGHVYRVRKSSFLRESAVVDGEEQIRELLFFNRITTSAVMVRRRCIEEVGGFHEELRNSQDRHMWVKLAKRNPVAYIAEPLVMYRVHPAQIHSRVDPGMAERAFLLFLEEVFGDPRLSRQLASWKGQAYSHAYLMIAGRAYGNDMGMARHYIRKAVRLHPRVMLGRMSIRIVNRYSTSLLPHGLWVTLRNVKRRLQDPVKGIRD